MSISKEISNELQELVKGHDWSYMTSDDHRAWDAGLQVERQIKDKIHALVGVCKWDAEALHSEVKSLAGPDYTDYDKYGYGLKYRTINGWFRPYTGLAEF